MEKKTSSFSGQIGFVLAAAGSAVGVGNLWRFPYLAAKDGGGLFLLVYLMLVLTFGFTLLTSDIAIGRRTKQSAIRAYETMRPKWTFLGILTFLVPVLIMTYYAVIGGWITKYAAVYLTGQSAAAAEDGYFTSFITSPVSPVVFALLFMGVTAFIVYNGVEGGIERVSRYMMPILLVLVLTFGFTLLTSDIAIGRRTKQSAIRAYETMRPKWKFLGILTFLVPVLIMTYYAVIGGWITKYAVVYLTGQSAAAAEDGYFTSFITSPVSPVVFALLFMGVTAFIVYNGVEGGIERVSRYMMPILLVLVVVIAGYALTLRHEDASGQMRTGLEGLRYYLTPHMEGLTVSRFLQILLDAMSQLFFSLSVSMGIMITYGSYVKPEVDLNKAVNQIEIFDTGVALLAGAMIIPAVYVFSGTEGMSAGPSLMFVSLPKVFNAMGKAGVFVGILFFVTAIFATLTSCISVLESITANCMEIFHSGRKKTVLVLAVIYLAASAIIALGYSIFYFEVQLPNGSVGQLLDIMDYVSNSVMMPFIALLSTILIGWVMTPDYVIDEMQRNGETFRRKKLYRVMIRYVAPVMMLVLFLQSTGILA